jgi:23S rRNA pseudouridine2605 synthase
MCHIIKLEREGLRAQGSGLGARDSGLGTRGSGLRTQDSGLGTRDSGLGTWGSGLRSHWASNSQKMKNTGSRKEWAGQSSGAVQVLSFQGGRMEILT